MMLWFSLHDFSVRGAGFDGNKQLRCVCVLLQPAVRVGLNIAHKSPNSPGTFEMRLLRLVLGGKAICRRVIGNQLINAREIIRGAVAYCRQVLKGLRHEVNLRLR